MSRRAMRLAGVIPGLIFLVAAGICAASDFRYVVNPPRVQVTSGAKVPAQLGPDCGTFDGLPLICYGPSYIRSAYDFPSSLDGSGQTIVIVDAYGSPTIGSDLARFDSAFGIAAPPSFTVVCAPGGCPAFNPQSSNQVGWSFETSLDVEYAHAMAPGANIVLVVASTNYGNALNAAETTAISRYPGSIMSQSFGIPEYSVSGNDAQILQAEQNYGTAQAAGITVLASAGDAGATNGASFANASFPASDPLVTAVGGTEGLPYPGGLANCRTTSKTTACKGSYGGEQVWNEPVFQAAGGGAPSLFFAAPAYQAPLGLTTRTTPDISYNAAVNGGVLVAWSALPADAGFYIVGGTSAGSPQWAAVVALANQLSASEGRGSLGFINPALYHLAQTAAYSTDFHDITVGNNQLTGTPVGFNAGPGWDDASGWGTPDVARLVPDLVACAKTDACP